MARLSLPGTQSPTPVAPSPEGGPTPVIRVRGVVTRFGAQVVHDGVDLDVLPGEVLGIVGGSGSGKSVLLREIVGLAHPTAGHIDLLGQDMNALTTRQRSTLLSRIGVLFQDGALFSSMTVQENIMVAMREHAHLTPSVMRDLARVKIAMVGLPPEAGQKYPSQLSGGMRKRAGLARALALDPEILFLDEPTAGLDPIGATAFDQLIGTLQSSLGLTVVMVTHDLDSLYAICDRIAVLVDRKIKVGTIATLSRDDNPWIKDYFNGPRGRAANATSMRG